MFSRYYQAELAYLRELGREFAAAHPALAGMLAERGGDPDVERLLEGFAFLSARMRERVDDAVPEIVHGLCDLLLPHYLRSLPACSIVEFLPAPGALRGRQRLPRGTEVASVPVEGTACRFRTTADLDLLPLWIEDVAVDQSAASAPTIKVRLRTTEDGIGQVFQPAGIRLHLHGELPTSLVLFIWLLRACGGVVVRGTSPRAASVRLGKDAIVAAGFDRATALVPWPELAPDGYRVVQEYFTLPAKFLFFDVRGLDRALGAAEERFELVFEFDRPPDLPARVAKDALKLHCAPVVNLFQAAGDPIRRETFLAESLVRASEIDPRHMEVYSVDSVTGLQAGRARRAYRPFFDFSHAAPDTSETSYYRVRRTLSPVDDAVDTYLAVLTARDVRPDLEIDETLSLELTCTNRGLPARLRVGDISAPTSGSPTTARFSNITPVTRPVRPPFGSELHWRLLSHLAVQQRSLADPVALRALVELYNFQEHGDERVGRANRLRVEGVLGVSSQPTRRLVKGTPVLGCRSTVELAEAAFAGRGDAFLFGAVLDHLFATGVTMNSFSELVVRLQPSQTEYSWPARSGRQSLI